jgi:hypothetical protein
MLVTLVTSVREVRGRCFCWVPFRGAAKCANHYATPHPHCCGIDGCIAKYDQYCNSTLLKSRLEFTHHLFIWVAENPYFAAACVGDKIASKNKN